jgi:hypothetical protein
MKRLLVLLARASIVVIVVVVVGAVGAVLAIPATAWAKPKLAAGAGPSACGYKSLPLAVGNTWTYKSGPAQVVLKIAAIAPGKDWQGKPATVIDVEELYNGKTTKTQWTCTPAGGLIVGLDSFFFTGEPGGTADKTFTVTDHEKPWLVPQEQLVGDVAWIEVVKADVTRVDLGGAGGKHPPAKIELERHAQLRGTETVTIGIGQFPTEKVIFEFRGRGIVEAEKAEIPIRRPATFWYTKGLGLVKIEDAFDKTWQLAESNLIVVK